MKTDKNQPIISVAIFLVLSISTTNATSASYLPKGPQINVPVTTVEKGGWAECYRDNYSNNGKTLAGSIATSCKGKRLMLACRTTGSSVLSLLAQGLRSDIFYDTGHDLSTVHTASGVNWYYSPDYSMGFSAAGDSVNKNPCDTNNSNGDYRLCWHTVSEGGHRCGNAAGLNGSTNYERIVYHQIIGTLEINPIDNSKFTTNSSFDGVFTITNIPDINQIGIISIILNKIDITANCSTEKNLLRIGATSTIGKVVECSGISRMLIKPGNNVVVFKYKTTDGITATSSANWVIYQTNP